MKRLAWLLFLSAFPSVALADDAKGIMVRQIASAGVYVSLCPTIEFGDGLAKIRSEAGITKADLLPGGRYREMMSTHAANLKASMAISGDDPCARGLDLYGPNGWAYRNLVRPKD